MQVGRGPYDHRMREAPTIVLIGAGSTSFGLTTLHDLYADPVFAGATVWLVDVDARPLERMGQRRGRARSGHPAGHHREHSPRIGRDALARSRRSGGVGRGRSGSALAARLRDPAPSWCRARARRERRSGRSRARAAHDPPRRRDRARRRAARARRAADQLHEPRRSDLYRVPSPPRPADHRSVSRSADRAGTVLRPSRAPDRVSRRGPQPPHGTCRRARHATSGADVTADLHAAVDESARRRERDVCVRSVPARSLRGRHRDQRQPHGRVLPRGGRARAGQGLPRAADAASEARRRCRRLDHRGADGHGPVPRMGSQRASASDPACRDQRTAATRRIGDPAQRRSRAGHCRPTARSR